MDFYVERTPGAAVQPVLQIHPGTVVVVLLYQEAGGGVLNKQGAKPFAQSAFRHRFADIAGKSVQTLPACRYLYGRDHDEGTILIRRSLPCCCQFTFKP